MSADEKVAEWVTKAARREADDQHLRSCPDLVVTHPSAEDGYYGCDTGCEYARLQAELSCPHGHTKSFEYGEFGDLADIIRDLERS